MENIHFWHGELNGGVAVSMVKIFCEQIEGEGHLSIFFNGLKDILSAIEAE